MLDAAGLVLPMATGIQPWLTPLAAVGLSVIVLLAAGFHMRATERLEAVETGLWAGLPAVIAIGRWDLVTSRADIPPWLLVVAVGVLVPLRHHQYRGAQETSRQERCKLTRMRKAAVCRLSSIVYGMNDIR